MRNAIVKPFQTLGPSIVAWTTSILVLVLQIQVAASASSPSSSSSWSQSLLSSRNPYRMSAAAFHPIQSIQSNMKDNSDVIQKFQSFFHSKQKSPLQRIKRKLILLHSYRQQQEQQGLNRSNRITRKRGVGGICKTKFTFRVPKSCQSLWLDMFAPSSSSSSLSSHLHFNNPNVGLTFPSFMDQNDNDDESNIADEENYNNDHKNEHDTVNDWFPPTKAQIENPIRNPDVTTIKHHHQRKQQHQWNIKRYTKHVGYGKECYEFVKDSVLNWEFHNDKMRHHRDHDVKNDTTSINHNVQSIIPNTSTTGIIKALPPRSSRQRTNQHLHQQQKPSHFNNGNRRRSNTKSNNNLNGSDDPNLNHDGNILSPLSSNMNMIMGIEENTNPNILQIWSAPSSSSSSTSVSIPISTSKKHIRPIDNNNPTIVAALGRKLVTYTKRQILPFLPSLYVFNPVCVVYDVLDQKVLKHRNTNNHYNDHDTSNIMYTNSYGQKQQPTQFQSESKEEKQNTMYTSTAYGTLNGHLLVGEERVTVVMRGENDNNHGEKCGKVDVEVISYSKPSSSILSRLIYPFIGKMQDEFFVGELEYMKQSYENELQKRGNK